jgi:hypothetical protein
MARKRPKFEAGDAFEEVEIKAPPMDAQGALVPQNLKDVFATPILRDAVDMLKQVRLNAKAVEKWHPFLLQRQVADHLEALVCLLEQNVPHVVCKCRGAGCHHCRSAGWLPRWKYNEVF